MKALTKSLFSLVLIFCYAISLGQVAIVDYMRVPPNNQDGYLGVESEWKKVHKERVKVGLIQGWYLYRIRHAGTDSPYQFATVTYYKDLDSSENAFFEGVFESALKEMDLDSFFVHTENIRDLTISEVFRRVDGLAYDYSNPAKFIFMNFIKVNQGQEENYEDIEKFVWKPMHQELQNNDKMASWSLWGMWFYGHRNYDYITMNEFHEYQDIDSYSYSDIFNKVHKGKDLSKTLKETSLSRTSTKTELWELIDYVAPEN